MPPSLISFSETPPAPARALVRDVGERMDALVDADRHPGRLGAASSGLRCRRRRAAARRTSASPCASSRRRSWRSASVSPQLASAHSGVSGSASRTACAMAISLASGFTPILSLKKWKPSLLLGMGLGDVLLGGRIAEQPHRLDARAPRLGDQIDQPLCRWRGRSGRAAPSRRRNARRRCRPARDAAPAAGAGQVRASWPIEHRREMIAHRRDQSALRVAGHGRRRGGLAPADACRRPPRCAPADSRAVVMVSPAIFIGALSGSATGMASTRRMTSGAASARGGAGTRARTFTAHTLKRGSRKSRRLSPNRLKANTARLIATPGNRIIHGASR